MRRFVRIFARAAVIFSLFLCAAAAAAWVRSYLLFDHVTAERTRAFTLYSRNGSLILERTTSFVGGPVFGPVLPRRTTWAYTWREELADPDAVFLSSGTFWFYAFGGPGGTYKHGLDPIEYDDGVWVQRVKFPYWCAVAGLALLPAVAAGRAVVRDRRCKRGAGRCRQCGYDLRATPDRCPECGTVPAGANGTAEARRHRVAEETAGDDGAG